MVSTFIFARTQKIMNLLTKMKNALSPLVIHAPIITNVKMEHLATNMKTKRL